jgi:hypothetical protein
LQLPRIVRWDKSRGSHLLGARLGFADNGTWCSTYRLLKKIEVTLTWSSCIVVIIPEAERGPSNEGPDILENNRRAAVMRVLK